MLNFVYNVVFDVEAAPRGSQISDSRATGIANFLRSLAAMQGVD